MRKYGIENFDFYIEIVVDNQEAMDKCEIDLIETYDTTNREKGYNRKEGGAYGKHSEESKKKMSKSAMGKVISKETRRKLSEANKGQIPWIKGRKHSEETRRKISIANKGKKKKPFTDEHIKNLSESHKGLVSGMKGKKTHD